MKSPKELSVNEKILTLTKELIDLTPEKDDLPLKIMNELVEDDEIQAVQDYSNNVSIVSTHEDSLPKCLENAQNTLSGKNSNFFGIGTGWNFFRQHLCSHVCLISA